MGIDLTKVKSRLSSLSNTNNKSNLLWKPNPGKQVIRIVPYAFNLENPFIELKFHFGINGKTYLSPDSFNRPDPIVEFSNKLKRTGDKEDYKFGKKLEPKLRTYAPVIVRGEEDQGVRFWGFGKQVYQELLAIISDPDYGDITDLVNGRDIVVEFKTQDETGKQFPETAIRAKPNATPAVDPTKSNLVEKLKKQTDILELFPELSYDELKGVMEQYLHSEENDDSVPPPTAPTDVASEAPKVAQKPATAEKFSSDDATKAFDKLFGATPKTS